MGRKHLQFYSEKHYQKIADIFRLGKIKKITYFYKGFQTPKVVATTLRGKFVISRNKLSNKKDLISKSIQSFHYEIDLLNLLAKYKLPVPCHKKTGGGKYAILLDGSWVTVYQFLNGKQPKKLTPEMARQLGAFLGAFHKIGQKFTRNLGGRRKFYDLSPTVMQKMHHYTVRQKNAKLRKIVQEVRDGVKRTRPSRNLPSGPIHVDLKPENELFVRQRLSGVVDFGNFYRGPLMIDIGKTIMWNCIKRKKLNRKLVKEFFEGYTSKRSINTAEQAYVKNAVLFAIYSHIYVDLFHVPLGYVPESYALSLVRDFLPVARWLEKVKL